MKRVGNKFSDITNNFVIETAIKYIIIGYDYSKPRI